MESISGQTIKITESAFLEFTDSGHCSQSLNFGNNPNVQQQISKLRSTHAMTSSSSLEKRENCEIGYDVDKPQGCCAVGHTERYNLMLLARSAVCARRDWRAGETSLHTVWRTSILVSPEHGCAGLHTAGCQYNQLYTYRWLQGHFQGMIFY